jgi:hypothetical protein
MKEDCLSRLNQSFEVVMYFYRIFLVTLSFLCNDIFCSWILIVACLLTGLFLVYRYFLWVPYYNRFVSIFFGTVVCTYLWITINAVIMKFTIVSGHIIIILLGIPFIWLLVMDLREKRIENLMTSSIEKINSDSDALIQITAIKDLTINKLGSKVVSEDVSKEMQAKGIINLHFEECKNEYCICKNLEELYDV